MFRSFRSRSADPNPGDMNAAPSPSRRRSVPGMPPFRLSTGNKIRLGLLGGILALIVFGLTSSAFWMRWWWYGSVGYRGVLIDRAFHQLLVLVACTVVALVAILGNGLLALRRTRSENPTTGAARIAHRVLFYVVVLASIAAAVAVGAAAMARWELFALALNGDEFGQDDPVFGRDIGFYLFTYPAIMAAWNLLFATAVIATVVAVVVYVLRLGLNVRRLAPLRGAVVRHISLMVAVLLALVGLRMILNNYDLVYSTRGVAVGASYTDLHAVRPANWIGGVALLLLAGICVASRRVPGRRQLVLIGATALFLSLGVRAILPAFVQETIVSPDELGKERPYIANNIAMTRAGFGLDIVVEGNLSGASGVSSEDIASNPTLVDNVRLWDYRVARETYQQLQTFAGYYEFRDVDVDRYVVDGEVVQVILSAREMNQSGLPENARTWTNRRLGYTHGYGVVASPVDGVTRSGLPTYLVENVPPTGAGSLAIDHPEIYFGEGDLGWVVVGTKVAQFTALSGVDQTITIAPGAMRGTIALDDQLTRLIAGLNLRDRNLMLSGNITDESVLVQHRNIADRLEMIAPFLTYDPDPYLVVADGRLVWVVDAYTVSDRFPHATEERGVNYVRASVKVTVDAGSGETIFYRTDEPDPIAEAYDGIYDDLFSPIQQAPVSVSSHFRYPELLYERQSEAYATVHVDDPGIFYSGEDRWAVPPALGSAEALEDGSNAETSMPAYYMTLPLPGQSIADFSIVRPYIPAVIPGGNSQRQTMTGWMAGRSDASGRLSLHAYAFPRQSQVFGPSQIEARINQEPTISRELTLWNQSGSQVIFGNLLVLPINDTVVYIQPLYLRSTGGSGIPELTRVIVATRDEVVIGDTLAGAFSQLTGSADPVVEVDGERPATGSETVPATSVAEAVVRANEAYERGQSALAAGDWATYGDAQADLATALSELEALTGSAGGTPVPAATPTAAP